MQENNVNENDNVVEDFDPVKEINELKKNSVPKEEYDKLKEEHNKTLKAIINGDVEGLELPDNGTGDSTDNLERIKELRNSLANDELNNLDYVTKALELRKTVIQEFGEEKDPFLPVGHNVIVEQSDIDTANRVAEVLEDLVEKSNGDSLYFTNELARITVDGKRPSSNKRK